MEEIIYMRLKTAGMIRLLCVGGQTLMEKTNMTQRLAELEKRLRNTETCIATFQSNGGGGGGGGQQPQVRVDNTTLDNTGLDPPMRCFDRAFNIT
jgi:hypothetical protein